MKNTDISIGRKVRRKKQAQATDEPVKLNGSKRAELDPKAEIRVAYSTKLGGLLVGKIEDALDSQYLRALRGKIDLIFTSPPFPLVRKKEYGNKEGEEYLRWLQRLSNRLAELLSPTGSIVVEIGNAWEAGSPVMSTL